LRPPRPNTAFAVVNKKRADWPDFSHRRAKAGKGGQNKDCGVKTTLIWQARVLKTDGGWSGFWTIAALNKHQNTLERFVKQAGSTYPLRQLVHFGKRDQTKLGAWF